MANIVFGGWGPTAPSPSPPPPTSSGPSTIRVTVSDGAASAFDEFILTVTAVNDAPTISNIADRTVNEDTPTGAVAFTVGDAETAAGSLTLTGTSSNTALVPVANVVFGGSGADRTVTVTPAANQSGTPPSASPSATARPAPSTSSSSPSPPSTTPPPSPTSPTSTVNEDTPTGAIAFTVGDVETAAGSLTLTRPSTNTALVPVANIVFGGSGANRTVTVTPAANQSGTSLIRITVSDGAASAFDEFIVIVTAVNDPPTISDIADQTTAEDTPTGAIAFTVGDVETAGREPDPVGHLHRHRPGAGGQHRLRRLGANRTVTVTPAAGQIGPPPSASPSATGRPAPSTSSCLPSPPPATPLPPSPTSPTRPPTRTPPSGPSPSPWATPRRRPGPDPVGHLLRRRPGAGGQRRLRGPGADRTVTVTPAADQSGTATIAVTVRDGSTSAVDDFVLTVNPVNDAPSFTKGPDQTVIQDQGAQTVSGWAGDLATGDAGQSLSFEVTTDNDALFSAQPALSATGTLTYTPATHATGTATVTVVLHDDGGTANGGVDTSAPQSLHHHRRGRASLAAVVPRRHLRRPGGGQHQRVPGRDLTNTGSCPWRRGRVAVVGPDAGDFAVVSDPCTGESVGAGLSCSVGVSFTPGGPGPRSAFLVVTDTAFASSPRSIPLTGTGLPPIRSR